MPGLENYILELNEYNKLISHIKNGIKSINLVGLADSNKIHFIYSIAKQLNRPCIIVTYNQIQARNIYNDLSYFTNADKVLLFPNKDLIFHEIEALSTDITKERLKTIDKLSNNKDCIIIIPIESLQQYTIPQKVYKEKCKTFRLGEVWDIKGIINDLIVMGYERVDMVEGGGQFSIRGGIIDVFSIIEENPYRIEFFDDEIDSIREFDVGTQISINKKEKIFISPAREIILEEKDINNLTAKLKENKERLEKLLHVSKDKEIIEKGIKRLEADIDKLNTNNYFPSIDKYLNLIYPDKPTIVDHTIDNSLIFIDEPSKIRQESKIFEEHFNDTLENMMDNAILLKGAEDLLISYNDIINSFNKKTLITMTTFTYSGQDYKAQAIVNILAKTVHSFHGKLEFLYDNLKMWQDNKYKVIILLSNKEKALRLKDTLKEIGLNSSYMEKLPKEIQAGTIIMTKGSLSSGFEYPSIKLALISDSQIFKVERKKKRIKFKHPSTRIKAYTDLNEGDYVVHQNHGIGRYIGINRLDAGGVVKDYLKIQYRGEDFLYVPTDQLDIVQKYISSGDSQPRLNKLGGTEWSKVKSRVSKSVQDLAKGLVKLYAARQSVSGYAFSKDTVWQNEFEETFIYQPTQDQLKSIEEVKEDMEKAKPMDRLLCGDVGYGKTEVAIRATFKAIMDGKQVAYLVPTTVLAQQHYTNFLDRMKGFPINIEMLSRFKTAKEQREIIKRLKTGEVDVVIGTHRLLQKDIKFKDIGFLIIDEEQRFGVSHKEKIKELKKNIDVLTLTATPIPRTLHMSMIGIRDMSIIESPPEDRFPVQTYVLEHNQDIIKSAIIKEISRGGQVYYLHNRVATIYKAAQELIKMVGNANIAVAHGQMNENELEDIMYQVLNNEVDILVCTTIIETGLDIPNMNTIIIEDSDAMGLAQLYQLKGRVGRSNRLAYAYLTYKKDKILNESAQKRLQAIKQYTEFGSGFKIAMRDLEIRGAGNLLGAEQHGHMAAVGYDMYCKLLEVAIAKLQGKEVEEEIETSVDININAYIPKNYINNHNQRIEIYKKISSIENLQDYYDIEEEIEDRYGNLPVELSNIINISLIKSMANQVKISMIKQRDENILFYFNSPKDANIDSISKLVAIYKGKLFFTPGNKTYLTYTIKENERLEFVNNIKIILQDLKELQGV